MSNTSKTDINDKFIHEIVSSDINNIWLDIKNIYEYIRTENIFRVAPEVLQVTDSNYDAVTELFPDIEKFRVKYNMSKFILFLEFNESDGEVVYEQNPHSHNTKTSGSIFFPIIHSEYTRTNFYEPPEDKILTCSFDDERYHTILECDWHTPAASYDIKNPVVMNVNEFHQPVELIKRPKNKERVVCNWKANINFNELIYKLYEV